MDTWSSCFWACGECVVESNCLVPGGQKEEVTGDKIHHSRVYFQGPTALVKYSSL